MSLINNNDVNLIVIDNDNRLDRVHGVTWFGGCECVVNVTCHVEQTRVERTFQFVDDGKHAWMNRIRSCEDGNGERCGQYVKRYRSDSSIALLTAAMPRPAALYNRRKWQLIGKSQWCCSVNCGHPLHALTYNWTRGVQLANTPPPQSTTPGLHPLKHSPDGAARARKHTSDYSLLLNLSTLKGWKAESTWDSLDSASGQLVPGRRDVTAGPREARRRLLTVALYIGIMAEHVGVW